MINTNEVVVVGTLVEAEAITGTAKTGKPYVRGDLTIKVGEEQMIPISFFSSQYSSKGTPLKNYDTFLGINEWLNKRVRVTATLTENKFFSSQRGSLVKSNRLNVRWINLLPATSTEEDSTHFRIAGFVTEGIKEVVDAEQNVTDCLIKIGQSNYSGTQADVFTLNVDPTNTKAVDVLSNQYTVGSSIVLEGHLDFTIKEEHVSVPSDFGGDMIKTYQKSSKRYVITQGTRVDSNLEYTTEDIQKLVDGAKANDEEVIAKAGTQPAATQKAAPAQPVQVRKLI